jgi:phage tail-like protein
MVDIPQLTLDRHTGPPLGFRFAVFFFAGGVAPNPLDILFQRVSGLSASVETSPIAEGGQNLYTHKLPRRVGYANLVLERGLVTGSPLGLEFNAAMSLFKFSPSNVMVTLLGEDAAPRAAWLFLKAFPVRWSTSDLNASEERLVIETLELAYTRMQALRL